MLPILVLLLFTCSIQSIRAIGGVGKGASTSTTTTTYNDDEFLSSFTAKLLVRIESSSSDRDAVNQEKDKTLAGKSIEVEEFYDKSRRLGKMSIRETSGESTELFVRAHNNLYFEFHYAPNGKLTRCQAYTRETTLSLTSGYFNTFRWLNKLVEQREPNGTAAHLIGPAGLLYLFHNELAGRWDAKAKSKVFGNSDDDPTIKKHRRRLIVEPKPFEVSEQEKGGSGDSGSGSGRQAGKLTFWQSDFLVERSPLLSKLAPFVTYVDSESNLNFSVDFLAIDEIDFLGQSSRDPYKLPAGFACLAKQSSQSQSPMIGAASTSLLLYEFWSRMLPIQSNLMSASIPSLAAYPQGVDLTLDLSRHLFRFDIRGQSRNVLDMSQALVYHMPNEPALADDDDNAGTAEAKNDECSILQYELLANKRAANLGRFRSLDRWRFFVGNTNAMIYLGRTRYKNGRLAHEFELNYADATDLPPLLGGNLLTGDKWPVSVSDLNLLIAKLWIAADDDLSSCPPDLYLPEQTSTGSQLSGIADQAAGPELLGFRVQLLDIITMESVKLGEEIELREFNWQLSDSTVGGGRPPYDMFDLRSCPLKKLHLSTEVKWMHSIELDDATECDIGVKSNLDDFVGQQLQEYLETFASADVFMINLERKSIPGTKVAKYSLELAETPRKALVYVPEPDQFSKDAMKSNLIDQFLAVNTLFECLTWASQFNSARAVLYSSKLSECLAYDGDEYRSSLYQGDQEEPYTLFTRQIQPISRATSSSAGGLKMFTIEQLDEINRQIRQSNRLNNAIEVCIGPRTLASDIRLSTLKRVAAEPDDQQTGYKSYNSIKVKSGFRFTEQQNLGAKNDPMWTVQSRLQREVVSFAQCLSLCEDISDCASFTHCSYHDTTRHQYCQLSDLKFSSDATSKVEKQGSTFNSSEWLTRDAGCEIHAKYYLAYFEPKRVQEMAVNKMGELELQNRQWHLVPEAESELDCASSCYSRPGESCMRFVQCNTVVDETNSHQCYQWLISTTGMPEPEQHRINSILDFEHVGMSNCSAYKRKAITLYRKTLSMTLVNEEDSNSRWTSKTGKTLLQSTNQHTSKESCAERCTLDVECQSFDSCLVISSSQSALNHVFSRFECTLIAGSIFDDGTHLIDNDHDSSIMTANSSSKPAPEEHRECAHYERLDGQARLSAQHVRGIVDRLTDKQALEQLVGSKTSYATTLFTASILGLALGVAAGSMFSAWRTRGQVGLCRI